MKGILQTLCLTLFITTIAFNLSSPQTPRQNPNNCPSYDPHFDRLPPTWAMITSQLVKVDNNLDPTLTFALRNIPIWFNAGIFILTEPLQLDVPLMQQVKNNSIDAIPNCRLDPNDLRTVICPHEPIDMFNNSNYHLTQNLCTVDIDINVKFSAIARNPLFWKNTTNYEIPLFLGYYTGSSLSGTLKIYWKEEHNLVFRLNVQTLGWNITNPDILVSEVDTSAIWNQDPEQRFGYFFFNFQPKLNVRIFGSTGTNVSLPGSDYIDPHFVTISAQREMNYGQHYHIGGMKPRSGILPMSVRGDGMVVGIPTCPLQYSSILNLYDQSTAVSLFIARFKMLSEHVLGYVNFKGNYCELTGGVCTKSYPFTSRFDNLEFRASAQNPTVNMDAVALGIYSLRDLTNENSTVILGSEKIISKLLIPLSLPRASFYADDLTITLIEETPTGTSVLDLIHGVNQIALPFGDLPPSSVPPRFADNVNVVFELDNRRGFFSNVMRPVQLSFSWVIKRRTSRAGEIGDVSDTFKAMGTSFKATATKFNLNWVVNTGPERPASGAEEIKKFGALIVVILVSLFTLIL